MAARRAILAVGLLLAVLVTSPTRAQTLPDTRPFHLGFTPFPYDISFAAVDFSYQALADHADIVMHHWDDGVPWPESLSGGPYSGDVQNNWRTSKSRTPKGHVILASAAPFSFMRDGLARYRGEKTDMPLPAPWDKISFNHPDVKAAYLNYCRRIIEYFEPAYFNIGIEANLVMRNAPALWDSYVELHRYVYTELKRAYPDLLVFVSFQVEALLKDYTPNVNHEDQLRAFRDLIDYTDVFAFSTYPYGGVNMTARLPQGMFEELAAMSNKPMAISETGYPAQDLTIKAMGLTLRSDETKQAAWIDLVLRKANEYRFLFVINFVIRDYDALWEKIGGGDFAATWRDTGLFDENGKPRKALTTWDQWLALPYQR